MTLTQYLDVIAEKLNIGALPDRLISTYLEAFAVHEGVDVSKMPDRLYTTYLEEILKARGVQSVRDKLRSTQLEALAGTYGATDLPDKLISTCLEAIINNLGDGNLWNPATNPMERGYYSSDDGSPLNTSTQLRTSKFISVKPSTAYTIESNLPLIKVLEYKADESFLKQNGWRTGAFTFTTGADTFNIMLNLRKEDSSVITVDDLEWLTVKESDTKMAKEST